MDKNHNFLDKFETRSRAVLVGSVTSTTSAKIGVDNVSSKVSKKEILEKNDGTPSPKDFITFLPWASKKFGLNAIVEVTKQFQESYVSALQQVSKLKGKSKIFKILAPQVKMSVRQWNQSNKNAEMEANKIYEEFKHILIRIVASYDHHDLTHIKFVDAIRIPRELFQIIGLIIPYHPDLNGITINKGVDEYTCYELKKLLSMSYITEICLDNTKTQTNYYLLLDGINNLKVLSLARCYLLDDMLKLICEKLEYPNTAASTLCSLNLSSNKITDKGATYIANFLRSNRKLYYLNLASNLITDGGAKEILSTLAEFPLGKEELKKYMIYLAEIQRANKETPSVVSSKIKPVPVRKGSTASRRSSKMKRHDSKSNNSRLDVNQDHMDDNSAADKCPFRKTELLRRNGTIYSVGNHVLCYINFCYNHLTIFSIEQIIHIIKYQNTLSKEHRGLLNVRIEGNCLPIDCAEFYELSELLNYRVEKYGYVARKSSVASRM